MELLAGSGSGGGFPGFGGPDPTVPGVPRYQNFYAPSGSSAEPGSGEFNIGFNPATHHIMAMNSGPVWRITPPEFLSPAKPECCEGLWEDVTNLSTITGLDPILWVDNWINPSPLLLQPASGARTFASNSTVGTNGVYGYSDTDGGTGTGVPPDWQPLSASPPNA